MPSGREFRACFPPGLFTQSTERTLAPTELIQGVLMIFEKLQEINSLVPFASHSLILLFSFLSLGAISSGFRLEESPFVPYDFMNSSTSPASPPGSIGDGWPRAKSPNGSSSVNWPPGKVWTEVLPPSRGPFLLSALVM